MFVTVGICTWNRAKLLSQCLEQLKKLVIPPEVRWELLVVNNNSTDETEEVLTRYKKELPLRSVFESKSGKSHALNRAVDEARGNYILWTDDDVLVDPSWLAAYTEAFLEYPEAALFGGPIQPQFEGKAPWWLGRVLWRVAGAYALRDFGEEPIPLNERFFPYGANYAVRREEQSKHHYDPRLGPRPGSLIRGEESAAIQKMLKGGVQGRWVPKARVTHVIPKERQTISYIGRFYVGHGEALTVFESEGLISNSRLKYSGPFLKFLAWLGVALLREARYHYYRAVHPPEIWIGSLVESRVSWGRLWGWLKQESN